MPIRYAIWSAVSTEAQAANDKASLTEQETACRQLASSRGWVETAGPFVIPGESRTRWVNLRDAEDAIPALRAMLNSAQHGYFDVLLLYNYNRLRDLLDPVSKTLAHYRVQIYSLTQPVEPIQPEQFNPYISDASTMMQGLARIISQSQISDLARKHAYAMPHRIKRGLKSSKLPYGYIKPPGRETDRNAVAIQNPSLVQFIIKAKDMLLAGCSIRQIMEYLEANKAPAPGGGEQWHAPTLSAILKNPFYAGYVRYGKLSYRLDPRTGKRQRVLGPESSVVIAPGLHQPLWDDDTLAAIEAEFAKRTHSYRGKSSNPFTGLLRCGICGSTLWMNHHGNFGHGNPTATWRCSGRNERRARYNHGGFNHETLMQTISSQIMADIQTGNITPTLQLPPPVTSNENAIADLAAQRKRLDDAYQMGLLTLDIYAQRITEIQTRLTSLTNQKQSIADERHRANERIAILSELTNLLPYIPLYIKNAPPTEVNHSLKIIIDTITVHDADSITITYK